MAGSKASSDRWLLTYSDMITLLMVFFVILYSMAQLDLEKYKEVAVGLRRAFGGSDAGFSMFEGASSGWDVEHSRPVQIDIPMEPYDHIDVASNLGEAIAQAGIEGEVSVRTNIEGVMVSLSEALVFAPGSAELQPQGKQALADLAPVLRAMTNPIRVEAHTDDRPTDSPFYPTNWELSTARAVAIARHLIELGVHPSRLSAAGFAEFQPLMPNDTPEHRAMNRRANLVIVYPIDRRDYAIEIFPEVRELRYPVISSPTD